MSSEWRKPSYSSQSGGNCVEVASDGGVLIRDTADRDGVTLSLPADVWSRFLVAIRLPARHLGHTNGRVQTWLWLSTAVTISVVPAVTSRSVCFT